MADENPLKVRAAQVVRELGLAEVTPNWKGCDPVWAAFEEMAEEGAVVVIKIDGQRKSVEDNGRYTIVISGGPLEENFFRTDTHMLEEGLAQAILYYSRKCWGKA